MLKGILRIINRDGYISKSMIGKELNIPDEVVGDGLGQLIRMGYILEDKTGEDCSAFCGNCPYAKNCGKKIVNTFTISDKGKRFLKS